MSKLGRENLLYSRYARLLRAIHNLEGVVDAESYWRAIANLREVYRRLRQEL